MSDRIILHITPQPYVNTVYHERKLFYIPVRCRYLPKLGRNMKKGERFEDFDVRDTGCELFNNTGFCRHTASIHTRRRKKRIIKYNDYKKKIRELCDEQGFELLPYGWAAYFYYPCPSRWRPAKRKRMHGQHKHTKPDVDNLTGAILDSLGKKKGEVSNRLKDEKVAQINGQGKFWIDAEEGYIEILLNQPLYNPFGVTFINQLP